MFWNYHICGFIRVINASNFGKTRCYESPYPKYIRLSCYVNLWKNNVKFATQIDPLCITNLGRLLPFNQFYLEGNNIWMKNQKLMFKDYTSFSGVVSKTAVITDGGELEH